MTSKRGHIDRMFEAIDARKFDALPDFFDSACSYERPGYAPINGLTALERFYKHERIIDRGRHNIESFVETADEAVAIGRFQGVLRDGSETQVEFTDVYRFAGERIMRRKTFFFVPAV